ncbi:hypothetical protein GCM10010402_58390 [Actinomadura luteofluorescens]
MGDHAVTNMSFGGNIRWRRGVSPSGAEAGVSGDREGWGARSHDLCHKIIAGMCAWFDDLLGAGILASERLGGEWGVRRVQGAVV